MLQLTGVLSVLMYCIFGTFRRRLKFSFRDLTVLVGQQEGHPACKTLGVGLLVVMI